MKYLDKVRSYITAKQNLFLSPLYEKYLENITISEKCIAARYRNIPLVISLTSYPARFSKLHLCIKSILLQSVKADRVILYLDDFVNDNEIPQKIKNLCNAGLEIKKIPNDLRCHKKYFFAMQEFPDSCIITFDDDVIYRRNTVKSLLHTHELYPKSVCALRVHKMVKKTDGNINSYNSWKHEYRKIRIPSLSLCSTGVGGVLYPPHLLPYETFNVEAIKKYCYKADDIWLKFMELKENIPVVWTPCLHEHPVEIAEWRDTGLNQTNVNKNENDNYIENMQKFTGIQLKNYC